MMDIKDCWVGSVCPGCSLAHDNNLEELLIEICPDCPERLSASCGTCLDHNTPFCVCWQRVTT